MNEQRTVRIGGELFTVSTEKAVDGGWSAHTVEPEVVGGLGDTREAAIRDCEEAMRHWLKYAREAKASNRG